MNTPPHSTAPQAGQPQPQPHPRSPQSGTRSAIVITTAVVGGVALLMVGASVAYSTFALNPFSATRAILGGGSSSTEMLFEDPGAGVDAINDPSGGDTSQMQYADTTGVTSLDLDVAGAGMTISFGDVTEAELTTTGTRAGEWRLEVDGDELSVETPDRAATTGCVFNCGVGMLGNASATLVLPKALSETGALDAEISLEGGTLRGSGAFRALDVGVEAGELKLEGSARSLAVHVEVGSAEVKLADVASVEVGIDTGSAKVALTGDAPDSVNVTAQTGSATLALPKGAYRVDAKAELGAIDNRLQQDDASQQLVTVRAETAKVTLS